MKPADGWALKAGVTLPFNLSTTILCCSHLEPFFTILADQNLIDNIDFAENLASVT
jgi:hypothetical protein